MDHYNTKPALLSLLRDMASMIASRRPAFALAAISHILMAICGIFVAAW